MVLGVGNPRAPYSLYETLLVYELDACILLHIKAKVLKA